MYVIGKQKCSEVASQRHLLRTFMSEVRKLKVKRIFFSFFALSRNVLLNTLLAAFSNFLAETSRSS
jgi:hypothetical protein